VPVEHKAKEIGSKFESLPYNSAGRAGVLGEFQQRGVAESKERLPIYRVARKDGSRGRLLFRCRSSVEQTGSMKLGSFRK
jgi:hypothetical protein